MLNQYKIIEKNFKPFRGKMDNEMRDWYWYKAIRKSDNAEITFGTANGMYELNETIETDIYSKVGTDGKVRFLEVRN